MINNIKKLFCYVHLKKLFVNSALLKYHLKKSNYTLTLEILKIHSVIYEEVTDLSIEWNV